MLQVRGIGVGDKEFLKTDFRGRRGMSGWT